jgi:hypothetical protein
MKKILGSLIICVLFNFFHVKTTEKITKYPMDPTNQPYIYNNTDELVTVEKNWEILPHKLLEEAYRPILRGGGKWRLDFDIFVRTNLDKENTTIFGKKENDSRYVKLKGKDWVKLPAVIIINLQNNNITFDIISNDEWKKKFAKESEKKAEGEKEPPKESTTAGGATKN